MLKAAFEAGVTVPEPLWASNDPAIFGKPFFLMRRVAGSAAAHRITRDPALDPVLPSIAERLGRELAHIHTIRPPRADLAFLAALRSDRPGAPDRRLSRLSRPSSGAAAGARMGHPLARNFTFRLRRHPCSAIATFAPAITCSTARS